MKSLDWDDKGVRVDGKLTGSKIELRMKRMNRQFMENAWYNGRLVNIVIRIFPYCLNEVLSAHGTFHKHG